MIWNKIKQKILWIFDRQWDCAYLKKCFKRNHKEKPEVIILGSSYSIFGYEDDKTINLSLPSQDIYYAIEIAKKCMRENEKIRKIILGMGYYALYCDLSLTKSLDENNRIYDVYDPLLKNHHNMDSTDFKKLSLKQKQWDIVLSGIMKIYLSFLKKGGVKRYFNQTTHTRERRSLISGSIWNRLPENEREDIASDRVGAHEKFLKFDETTLGENKKILKNFKNTLINDTLLYIFVPPMTEEYLHNMSAKYNSLAKKSTEFCKSIADKFMDLNETSLYRYSPKDFVDADHLSDSGAKKMTKEINKWIRG